MYYIYVVSMIYDSNWNSISCQYTAIWYIIIMYPIVINYILCVCGLKCLYNLFTCTCVMLILITKKKSLNTKKYLYRHAGTIKKIIFSGSEINLEVCH